VDRRSLGRLIGPSVLCWAVVSLFGSASTVVAADRSIPVLPATGVVDAVLAGYLSDGISRAEQAGAPAVVIRLDTPGGDLQATQQIVSALLEATIPTIVWVAPAGGRAASAGTFITLAANVALMAPGTEIGAASPVGGQGEDIPGTLGEKVKNDAIAKIRSIAEVRGRNVDWAVSTVDRAISSPASEAVAMHAVDGIAATYEDVRAAANGRVVSVYGGRQVTIDLAGATFDELAMNPFQGFLHLLSDPNIAFILFTLGFYGLLFELQSPNFVTGILGGLAIILAFVGFGSLPLNLAGLLLIGIAIILFALETTVTSHGLLAVGGLVCFVLGASALYTEPGDPLAPAVSVALPLLVVTSLTTAAFMGLIAIAAVRTRGMASSPGLVGSALTLGSVGVVQAPLAPTGSVRAGGEEWTARTADGETLERGTPVRVVQTDGLTLVVEPDPSPPEQG
jgi:membrane-bound serine protease (ClpP class)